MRFMMLLKADKNTEAGVLPDEKILVAMGKYNDELIKAGVLLTADGLQASAKGFRIRNAAGQLTIIDGPFTETKELLAGFWLIQVKSKEEAIEWAKRCPFEADGASATAGGVGQIELRQVAELADPPASDGDAAAEGPGACLNEVAAQSAAKVQAQPAGGKKTRYMMMFKADANSEAGTLPSPKVRSEMGNLVGEMAQAGILLAGEGLMPSKYGTRIHFAAGKRTVTDGPFAEVKELIAGFCIVQLSSKQEVIEWAKRGMQIHGDGVSEVRPLFDTSDFPAELLEKVPQVVEAERAFRERDRARA